MNIVEPGIFILGCFFPNLYKPILGLLVIVVLVCFSFILISITSDNVSDSLPVDTWLWDQVEGRYKPYNIAQEYNLNEFRERFYKPGSYFTAYTSLKYGWELTEKEKGIYFK